MMQQKKHLVTVVILMCLPHWITCSPLSYQNDLEYEFSSGDTSSTSIATTGTTEEVQPSTDHTTDYDTQSATISSETLDAITLQSTSTGDYSTWSEEQTVTAPGETTPGDLESSSTSNTESSIAATDEPVTSIETSPGGESVSTITGTESPGSTKLPDGSSTNSVDPTLEMPPGRPINF